MFPRTKKKKKKRLKKKEIRKKVLSLRPLINEGLAPPMVRLECKDPGQPQCEISRLSDNLITW
jgi:hypothetical protein